MKTILSDRGGLGGKLLGMWIGSLIRFRAGGGIVFGLGFRIAGRCIIEGSGTDRQGKPGHRD